MWKNLLIAGLACALLGLGGVAIADEYSSGYQPPVPNYARCLKDLEWVTNAAKYSVPKYAAEHHESLSEALLDPDGYQRSLANGGLYESWGQVIFREGWYAIDFYC
jgi:hypothetical protein